jgi:hypothetical protein
MLSMWLCTKYFSQPSLVLYFSSNLTHKTGLQIGGKTTNNNPLEPMNQSNYLPN